MLHQISWVPRTALLAVALTVAAPALFAPETGGRAEAQDYCRGGDADPYDNETTNHRPPRRKTQDVYDHIAGRFRDAPLVTEPVVASVPVQTTPTPPPRRRTAPPPPPPLADLPHFEPDQILVADLGEADLATLLGQGYVLLRESDIPGLGISLRLLRIPGGVTLPDARGAVRALPSGGTSDFNHFYRAVQGAPGSTERTLVGWPLIPSRDAACGSGVAVGMIDSGINENHATFAGARLEVLHLPREAEAPSGAVHGTGVAALLVGDPGSRSPGLLPGASLVAVDAFYKVGTDERTDTFALLEALGLLSERGVKVINLSLAGPENTVLAAAIGELTLVRDTVVVAAVGNDGPDAEPAYPAAYEPVLAVTAVDQGGALYEQAVRGDHVDLSAPGVNVWTAAAVKGARWKTGTSFAVPFVTAAAAVLRQTSPELTVEEVSAVLRGGARDLGVPGFDPDFGAGLLNLGALCDPGL